MKATTEKILACPICLGSLQLKINAQDDGEIVDGMLNCSQCAAKYPIKERIPRMIPSNITTEREDLKKHFEIMSANTAYHDLAADTYEEDIAESGSHNLFNQERIEKIVKELSQKNDNSNFLDIGCGTGNILKFGEKYFQSAVGIDVSINMLKLAEKKGLEVIQADSLFLPFRPNIFNCVSIFSVLHHIYYYQKIFSKIFRIMREGAFLYTDWDPLKRPQLALTLPNGTSGIIKNKYICALFICRSIECMNRKFFGLFSRNDMYNLRKEKPEIKAIYKLAEYHEQKTVDERGIDLDLLMEHLTNSGFSDIRPTFHWAGKSFCQLNLTKRADIYIQSRIFNLPIERLMENVQIITHKGRNL